MRFLAVLGVFFCAVALAKSYKEFGITTPEELRSESWSGRIVEGSPAAPNQFPHHAYLAVRINSISSIVCAASLISTRWAITAAHCLQGYASAELYLGNIASDSSPVVITTTNFHVHPNYDSFTLNNDIALLGWNSDVPLGPNIRPIALAKDSSLDYAGEIVTASGFGSTSNSGSTSSILRYVNLRVITNAVCQQSFGSTIIASTICAVGSTSSAQGVCGGDSGGPLILGSGTNATLVGIVSFVSTAGCTSSFPNGFVRPNHFVSWINSVTGLRFDE